ncbi:MAG: SDR family oxidoreductase [Phycisphaerales bacterium]
MADDTRSLRNRRAYVCGSTQGIGKACAVALAQQGATVTLIARHAEALAMVRDELATDHGQTHDVLTVDFDDWQRVRDIATAHAQAHGPIHVLVNNTGGPAAGRAIEARPEEFLEAFSRHIMCNQVLAQAVAMGMRDAGFGRIINIISTSVVTPIRGLGVSNTIRGAVANWGRTLADELGQFGITVNNVLPGFTRTARLMSIFEGRASRAGVDRSEIEGAAIAQIPARRLASADEIAATVCFLASPAGGYINGVNLPVDGGRLAAQ